MNSKGRALIVGDEIRHTPETKRKAVQDFRKHLAATASIKKSIKRHEHKTNP